MRSVVVRFGLGALAAFTVIATGNAGTKTRQVFTEPERAAEPHRGASGSQETAVLLATTRQNTQSGSNGESHSPTYLRDVQPIFLGKCFRCHNDQARFLSNWLDYNTALADRHELKRRVWDSWKGDYFKQPMPILNSPEAEALTEQERRVIRDWVESGAVRGVPTKRSEPHSKDERMQLGKQLFTTICAACHQPTAQGIPNRFPPLARSDFLNSNKERAIGVLLHGLQGEVVVNGLKFNNAMPLFPFSDSEIAAALTYVYSSFGNSGMDVTTEEVKALRGRNGLLTSVPDQRNNHSNPAEKSPWE